MSKIIIIGSGIGGLVAGNLLVKKGHKVTIFETHSMPGGYTAGFYRKGCYFESGTISFESASTVFKAMKDIGVLDKIEFVKLGMRIVSEYFDGMPGNYEEFKKIIHSAFPADKDRLDEVFSDLDAILSVFMGSSDMIMPSVLSRMEMFKSILPYISGIPKMIKITKKYEDVTTNEFASKHFEKDTVLYNLFSRFSYPDTSAIFLATALAGVFKDIWTVKSGMQSWADILAEKFMQQGGDLELNSYVDSIITKNRTAIGVSCKNINYEADYIISAGDYKKTFLKLLDNKSLIPVKQQDRILDASVSESFFTVYLVLDMPEEKLAKFMKCPHIFNIDYKPGYDIYDYQDEDYFKKTAFYLYSPTIIKPELAPYGKSSLMIQSRTTCQWMNNWSAEKKGTYVQIKKKAMDTLIDRADGLIPNLKECIIYKDAATPLTYERFTQNSEGASSAWSWNPKKKFFKSILGTNIMTPVKNLFIGSSWAMQVGGVPGAISAAYLCIKKIK